MNGQNLKFVIVGHMDHGKSTLIGRLLYDTDSLPADKIEEIKKTSRDLGRQTEFAYLLDHLEEERQQGITIETTRVFFKADRREYVIIDAPGHVEFVKNMITGASQAEAAVLIIDVKEGVREQTRRHAYILSLLGLKQVIVVLNKMDLVDYSQKKFEEVKKDIEQFLASIEIEALFYIPISAIKGRNIAAKSEQTDWYKGPTFLESLNMLKNRPLPQDKPLIFPAQDIYKMDGKRIIVGRIEAGTVKQGQTVRILPANYTARINSIEKYTEDTNSASVGESIGITTEEPVFINRGDILCIPDKEPVLTDKFSANIFWMAKKDFTKGDRMTIRCATQETTCQIKSINKRINSTTLEVIEENAQILKNLEVAEAIIKTKKPIAIKMFSKVEELGRFIFLRGEETSAGGIVTYAG